MKIINGYAFTDAAAMKEGTFNWVCDNKCKYCGEPFVSISAAARYCSVACKQAAYRQRKADSNARQRFVTAKSLLNAYKAREG